MYDVPSNSTASLWDFNSTAPLLTIIVAERSAVVNAILHIVYQLPLQRYGPKLEELEDALACLHKYGIQLGDRDSDINSLLIQYAPTQPFRVYTAAASHGIESVCVAASEYTLPHSLDALSEANALVMGAVYLRRLVFLHLGRREALIRVIRDPPATHQPTATCSIRDQEAVERTWAVTTAGVMISPMSHGTTPWMLIGAYSGLISKPNCETCRNEVRKRVSDVLREWLAVKRTI